MGCRIRVLIVLAIAAPLFVATGGRAIACSCAPSPADRVLRRADAVVAGHVIDEATVDAMTTRSTLAVDGVYRGRVPATITLEADVGPGGGSTCAVLYPVGASVDPLVLERLADGAYRVDVCALLSADEIRSELGAPRAPPPGAAGPGLSSGPSPARPPIASAPATGHGLSWPAIAGGLALALVAMIVVVRRARGDEPADADEEGGDGTEGDGEAPASA